MAFDPRVLDDIRSRISLSQLIGRTVALKRAGREYKGLSPFNKERTPSFYVNDEKQRYFCFSSSKSGDCFTWLMETQGLQFMEAVKRLAEETGVVLPERDPETAHTEARRRDLSSWLEAAQALFARALHKSPLARSYLEGRGFGPETWDRFALGYAPEGWRTTTDALLAQGAREEDLLGAGLMAQSQSGERRYDVFRHRVTFAIRDPGGRIVGFGGRALDPKDPAKYLNSPETPLFDKGRLLYRFPEARAAYNALKGEARPGGLLIVEGYFDALTLARAGIETAVAPLGTALTEAQLALAWRVGAAPILCFDGDAAGRRAALRAIDKIAPQVSPDRTVRFAFLPPGRDPDDLVREQGAAAMTRVLAETAPLVDLMWERERDAGPRDTPEARAGLKRRLLALAKTITDGGTAEEYRRELLDRYDRELGRGRAWTPGGGGGRGRGGAGRFARPGTEPPDPLTRAIGSPAGAGLRRETERLLAALLASPELLAEVVEPLAGLPIAAPELAALQGSLVDLAFAGLDIDKAALDTHLRQSGFEATAARLTADYGWIVHRSAPLDLPGAVERWRADASGLAARMGREETDARAMSAARQGIAEESRTALRAAALETAKPVSTRTNPDDEPTPEDRIADIRRTVNDSLARKRRRPGA